ncbi:S1C family serine protease [Bradyrhizobium sp. Ash2021]|uniref:S1C family serine protease n=1 Tax=Bradyrhizobium sp. Ash2021 TaxID=2954771 RepID=UPI0028168848|nr:S1C family serine protease [Bradyrhizobium sp. Ash2021]WMT79416.1 S1C family serine protease [Bradyrhizobium sp. Ash2021]
MTDPSATNLSLLSSAVAGVVARATPAIVSVHSHRSRASGFVWKPNFVVTADEALADEGEISIELSDGTVRPGKIAGRDHTTDVALLRIDAKDSAKDIAPIKISPGVPMLGSLSVVVAAERGVPAAALGTVSLVGGRWRSLRGGEIDARIELDVRLRHSHQGGLVLDASGDAIGMAVLGPRRVIVIPAATIERVAGRLETHGRIARGYLGVGLQAVKLDDGVGAMVMNVDKSGPSAAAGIRQGDVIVGWNDDKISGVRSLLQALGPDSVGSVAEVTVRRAGEPVRFKLTIGERPET